MNKRKLALAQIGIIAVIDEVTGYQEVRDKKALRKKYKEIKKEQKINKVEISNKE